MNQRETQSDCGVNQLKANHKNTETYKRFGISIETVRRDLEYLENQGLSAASLWRCGPEDFVGQWLSRSITASQDHADEKNVIAAAARSVSRTPGDSIFLGVGTTTAKAMAQYLKTFNLTALLLPCGCGDV